MVFMKIAGNMKIRAIAGIFITFGFLGLCQLSAQTVWLDELDLSAATQG